MSLVSSDINMSKLGYLRLLLLMRLPVWGILGYWMRSLPFNPFQSPNPIFYCLSVSWICVPLWTKYPSIFSLLTEWSLYLFMPKWNPFPRRLFPAMQHSSIEAAPSSGAPDCHPHHFPHLGKHQRSSCYYLWSSSYYPSSSHSLSHPKLSPVSIP